MHSRTKAKSAWCLGRLCGKRLKTLQDSPHSRPFHRCRENVSCVAKLYGVVGSRRGASPVHKGFRVAEHLVQRLPSASYTGS
jgi:hypothetical protein